MRVITLLPSATEIVAALGAEDAIVGVSHECDYPPDVRSRERVTSCSVHADASPAAIDAEVRTLAAAGGALYTLREDAIAALAADVLVTQQLCEVCAVSETDVRALAHRLSPSPRVVTLGGTTIDGILADIREVAAALGAGAAGEALVLSLGARMRAVHDTLAAARAPRPRVAVIEWTDPVFAAGHWVPEMVRRAGGVDVLAVPGEHSRVRSIDEVATTRPDILLVAPCGYDLPRAAEEASALLARAEWAWTRSCQLWALDANAFVSRPGPRVVDGIELFARIFNPQCFGIDALEGAVRVR